MTVPYWTLNMEVCIYMQYWRAKRARKKKDNNKVKTTVWPPLLPIKPLFPACFCGYSLMFSYIQRSLQNNILSNIEELKMLKKNNTIMCDTYIRLYYNSFHSAAFITNILYRDQGFFKLNSPVHLWQIRS